MVLQTKEKGLLKYFWIQFSYRLESPDFNHL